MYSLRRKLYTNYTLNYTLRRFKPYTASVRKTIHEAEHKPYILFLNTNLANGTELMGQLMGINGEIEKPFPLGRGWGRLQKIQQF